MLRIGVTTRITEASGYIEARDSLAQEWGAYFKREFPDDIWISIPNLGKETVRYFRSLSLNVLILSGGDSIGETPKRDITERALLEYALKNAIPIIAVCRGMQLVHSYFGGSIVKGDQKFIFAHKATEHEIITEEGQIVLVNSYHNNKLKEETLHKNFSVLARCKEDDTVEAFKQERLLAIMWHPERVMKDQYWSSSLIKRFLQRI